MKGHERQSGLKVVGRKDEKEEKGLENESASQLHPADGGGGVPEPRRQSRGRGFPAPSSFENTKPLK